MSLDLHTKKIQKNAFRISKVRNRTAIRIRVPGGHLSAKYLPILQKIADEYGNGSLHITTRQGFEIPGIDYANMKEINKLIQPLIGGMGINQPEGPDSGYNSAGTRNVAACIGNRVCPFACFDTTSLAKRIEKQIFPNNLHTKIAITGCPNDCIKSRMHDFGIIGMTLPQYDPERCISCLACVEGCTKKSTMALSERNLNIERDHKRCIGCGECILACPTRAMTRSTERYYKLAIMGRTGRRNPRLAQDFINWVDEDSICKIIANTYRFVEEYINLDAPGGKEHIGYIIDRTGFKEYLNWAMEGVVLGPEAEMRQNIYWT